MDVSRTRGLKMPMYEGIGLTGDKQAVVLDIGTAYTKFGFTGEPSPRCIIRTEVKYIDTKKVKRIYDFSSKDELYQLLVSFIHNLYFKHLLVSPKDRRVIVVESLLSTTIFRDTLAKVLFEHFEVSSLLFVPSHQVSLCVLGVKTALVLDIGYKEALLIPVFEGIPILHAWQAQPLAAEAIHSSLKSYLSKNEKYLTTLEDLCEEVIEDIKVRTCFITTLERSQKVNSGETLPPLPTTNYRAGETISFDIPFKVREFASEILFERDNDEMSISTMVLDAIIKCPIDMRKPLAENILLIGGTSMMIGMKSRLQSELQHLVSLPKYSDKLAANTFKFHNPPAKENYVPWLGASIFGATELLLSRSLTKEAYALSKTVPDWSNLLYNQRGA